MVESLENARVSYMLFDNVSIEPTNERYDATLFMFLWAQIVSAHTYM